MVEKFDFIGLKTEGTTNGTITVPVKIGPKHHAIHVLYLKFHQKSESDLTFSKF